MKFTLRGFLLLSTCLVTVASARHVAADTTANCEKKGTVGVLNKGILSAFTDSKKSFSRNPSSLDVPLDIDGMIGICDTVANSTWSGIKAILRGNGQPIHTDDQLLDFLYKYSEGLICGLPGEGTGQTDGPVYIEPTDDDQYYNGRTVTLANGKTRTNPVGQHIMKMAVEGKHFGFFINLAEMYPTRAQRDKISEMLNHVEYVNGKPETTLDFIDRLLEDSNYDHRKLISIKSAVMGLGGKRGVEL